MGGRIKDNKGVNPDFERLGFELAELREDLEAMQGSVKTGGINLTIPEPNLPFKISERQDTDGLFLLVKVNIPDMTKTLRIQLLRKAKNAVLSGETNEQAKTRARRQVEGFRIIVSEDEAAAGFVEREIGPIKPRKDNSDESYQLIRLLVLDEENGAFATNPSDSPFETFPFPALIVRNDMGLTDDEKKFFLVGEAAGAPGKPSSARIVINEVNIDTQAADARIGFEIFASEDGTKTFEEVGAQDAFAVIRPFSETGGSDGATQEADNKFKIGGPIVDRTKKSVIVETIQPLGKRFRWKRTILTNAAGRNIATPDAEVSFYAGGDPPTAGIPEIETFSIAVTPKNSTHSLVTVTLKQFANDPMLHPRAALCKRITLYTQEQSGQKEIEKKIPLLDEEDAFIQGNTVTFVRKVQHKANQTGLKFGGTLFGINHTSAIAIKREANIVDADSVLTIKPSAPAANLITTAPDDDTTGDDAFADFTVFANADNPATTFVQAGIDHVAIVLRKKKTASGTDASDDPDDTRLPKFIFPIENNTVASAIFRVRGLKLGRAYIWSKNINISGGINKQSDKTDVPFKAGQMVLDIAGVTVSLSVVQKNKRHARATVSVSQPATAVLLKNVEILQDLNDGGGFVELVQVPVKNKAEFQVASTTASLSRNIETPPKNPNIRYKAIVRAVGGATVESAIVTRDSGDDSPGFSGEVVPSAPSMLDVPSNKPDGDPTSSNAVVVLRVWASDSRGANIVSLGRPLTFGDANITNIEAVIKRGSDASGKEPIKQGGSVDPADTFIDIEFSLPFGKLFTWIRNIAENSGARTVNASATHQFPAGGETNLLNLTVALNANDIKEVDKRHSDAIINITQPPAVVIFKRVQLLRKITVRGDGGALDADFKVVDKERVLDFDTIFTASATTPIPATIKHPKNCTFQLKARVIGFNGQQKESNTLTVTVGDEPGIAAPTDAPSAPSLGLLTSTINEGQGGDHETRATIFADISGTKTFATVGADTVIAVFRRVGSTANIPISLTLDDTQRGQLSVVIECAQLKFGKQYEWIKNINQNGGGRKITPATGVTFRPGNLSNLVGLIQNFNIQALVLDPRISRITVNFDQPSQPVQLKTLQLFQQQSAVPGDTLRVVEKVDLVDAIDANGNRVDTVGMKSFVFITKHKKPVNMVTYRARLKAFEDATNLDVTIVSNISGDDTGPPSWAQVSSDVRIRWRGTSSAGVLRAKTQVPDANILTLYASRSFLYFRTPFSGEYIWNPDLAGSGFQESFQSFTGLPVISLNDPYQVDTGLQPRLIFNVDRPIPPAMGDLPSSIYDALQVSGGSMEAHFRFFNRFMPSNIIASTGATFGSIPWTVGVGFTS